ncbi:MAG: GAF domain-containing protein [Cytophagales bacterium]|nr:GAF domain-containing protein [Bernardetiaceae bacterium]MDW8205669.1 GAF domain-containing protein [Cytophagales bacterium]
MFSLIKRLSEVGVKNLEGEEQDLITRIKITNLSILMVLAAFLTVGLISAYLEPGISVNIIIQIIGLIVAYVLIFIGSHFLGRILFCTVFSIGMLLLHIQLVKADEELLPITVVFQMTFWIFPLHIFHPKREWLSLIVMSAISIFAVAILPYATGLIEDESITHAAVFRSPVYFFIGSLTAGFIIATFLSYYSSSYQEAKDKLNQMQENLLAEKASLEKANNELRASLAELEALQANEEIRKKNILQQAELSEILRAHSQDLEKAADRAISLITRYIEADAGALFLHDEHNHQDCLEMAACYANGKRKYISKKFKISEGLVGQTFMEKAYIVAQNMPEEHLQIASGLGEHAPTNLLLVPMMQNDVVIGVMEFASFRPFSPLTIETAEKLANLTASFMITTRINQRTQELLIQSQQQTEDLRAREEEMRQNMEELAATQEEMARINDELSNKSIAVNILLGMVEIGTDKRILSVNDNFVEMMGYSKEELLTMTHSDLVPFDVYDKQEYELWWDNLLEGKIMTGRVIRIDKNGKKITLNSCYRPVFSSVNGEIIKIVKYCYPVVVQL